MTDKIDGLPVIDVDESEEITVAVRADDLLERDAADPEQHPIAIALRRRDDVDEARVTNSDSETRSAVARIGFATMPPISVAQADAKNADG